MAQDIVKGFQDEPQTLNLYLYVINNPKTYIDPDGLVYRSADELAKMIGGTATYISTSQGEGYRIGFEGKRYDYFEGSAYVWSFWQNGVFYLDDEGFYHHMALSAVKSKAAKTLYENSVENGVNSDKNLYQMSSDILGASSIEEVTKIKTAYLIKAYEDSHYAELYAYLDSLLDAATKVAAAIDMKLRNTLEVITYIPVANIPAGATLAIDSAIERDWESTAVYTFTAVPFGKWVGKPTGVVINFAKNKAKSTQKSNSQSSSGVAGQGAGGSNNQRMTTPQATTNAKNLGYEKTNYTSHGQPVFYNKKTKKYITPDVDQHNGGIWKMAKSPQELGSKSTRIGTYDSNLVRIGD
jgi:hypothetical protein